MKVLVVEDYAPIRNAIAKGLREAAMAVDCADNGEDGLWYAGHTAYDVIILDVMLPRLDGISVLKRIREEESDARVLLLTAKDAVPDRVAGLGAGADDYLVKPFAFDELLARVKALVRRRHDQSSPVLKAGNLSVDTESLAVLRGGESIELTKREYSLLHFLLLRRNEWVSRTEIWENVYQFDSNAQSNVVDVYVGYLRRKLERDDWPQLIHTRRGFGYRLFDGQGGP
ncbi:response regulator transcription factor [Lacipirellula sp.]|uniref:response regulator transcription factor n=1 Tax=Lacipirellula sp. TaxID=2691419 RepID=UPI003D1191AB